jgi:hypothetical protein
MHPPWRCCIHSYQVDVQLERILPRPVYLEELRQVPALASMQLFKQSRLSVSPLTDAEFDCIIRLSEAPSVSAAATSPTASAIAAVATVAAVPCITGATGKRKGAAGARKSVPAVTSKRTKLRK